MPYTFQQEGGNIAVYQNGQRISTTTPQNAASTYNYGAASSAPTPNNLPAQTSALQSTPPPNAPATLPQPTPQPASPSPSDKYLQSYLDTLKPSTEENQAQSQLDALTGKIGNINASRDLGIQDINEQPIATPFLTGQATAITNRAAVQAGALGAQATPLRSQLAMAQAKRQSAMDVSKAALEYATNQEKNQFTTLPGGSALYNNKTGQIVAQNPTDFASNTNAAFSTAGKTPITLGNGQTVYADSQGNFFDASGKPVSNSTVSGATAGSGTNITPPKTTTSGTTNTLSGLQGGKTYVSGNLQYSPTYYQADQKALISSRGTDGWVNPQIYLNLYNAWIGQGGLKSDFLKVYPVSNYINPANTWPQIQALGGGTKTTTRSA